MLNGWLADSTFQCAILAHYRCANHVKCAVLAHHTHQRAVLAHNIYKRAVLV